MREGGRRFRERRGGAVMSSCGVLGRIPPFLCAGRENPHPGLAAEHADITCHERFLFSILICVICLKIRIIQPPPSESRPDPGHSRSQRPSSDLLYSISECIAVIDDRYFPTLLSVLINHSHNHSWICGEVNSAFHFHLLMTGEKKKTYPIKAKHRWQVLGRAGVE